MPVSWEEAVEQATAIISDRSEPELKRRAMEVLLRYAERGRRASTSKVKSAQSFVRTREILQDALRENEVGLETITESDD